MSIEKFRETIGSAFSYTSYGFRGKMIVKLK